MKEINLLFFEFRIQLRNETSSIIGAKTNGTINIIKGEKEISFSIIGELEKFNSLE